MDAFERRTITIDRDDQRVVLRGHLAQSRTVFILLGALAALSVVAAGVSALGPSPPDGWGLAVAGVVGALVGAAVLIWIQAVVTRKQLPLGSEMSLAITEGTFDIDGAGGADRIRWGQLSNLKRVGGGLYVTVAPSNARLGIPGRLIDDAAFARAIELVGRPAVAEDRADILGEASVTGVLSSSIVFSAVDQRVARAALLRASWKTFVVFGVLALIGVIGLMLGAAGILPGNVIGYSAAVMAIAVISSTVVVTAVNRTVKRSLTIGTAQTLTITPDALELTGPGGATRFLWSRLFDLRRTQNVVTVRSMPAKTTLLFVGRLIGDELYAAIEQHIRMASATAQRAPES
ncbi:MAG: hypothetical protein JF592_02435 [Microbacterium sp.]|uniref:hypothetical protein n=1 Tax=Microbacterium sp. TaxID=51671 RepID=UPI001DC451A7|nr:hypothetical protein [Microbacterium sp.]MBW8761425.1 hypothetical protein [Microbacterium sp.]